MDDDATMRGDDSSAELMAWQLVDSGLPTGGFAHSFGLEAAASLGSVVSPENGRSSAMWSKRQRADGEEAEAGRRTLSLKAFVEAQLESMAASDLPFVHQGHGVVRSQLEQGQGQSALQGWLDSDRQQAIRLHINPVAFQASKSLGGALLRIASAGLVLDEKLLLLLEDMRKAIVSEQAAGLFSPLFGAITSMLGIDARQAQKMFLFMTLRDMVSAAKRLGLIGPYAGVALTTELSPKLEQLFQKYRDRPVSQAHLTFPLGDISQSCHNLLFRKLFVS